MLDTGISTEEVDGARLLSTTEVWGVFPEMGDADFIELVGPVVLRCLDLAQIRANGTYDLAIDVRLNNDRVQVTVDVPRVTRRVDMDGAVSGSDDDGKGRSAVRRRAPFASIRSRGTACPRRLVSTAT